MAKNQPSSYRRSRGTPRPQQFDIAPPKKAAKTTIAAGFPTVGMTLSTYSGSAKQSNNSFAPPKQPRTTSRWSRFWGGFSIKRVCLVLLAVVLLTVGYLGFKFAYNANRLFGANVFSALTSSKLDGEDSGRVNILLAGNSADDPGHQGGSLTDSIMILSVDTKNNTAYMMSIPRDLYVSIPGHGHQKINSVYPIGEKEEFSQGGYADGGMGLLQKIIQTNLGITTQYYALVNYNALRDATNSVGGVDITVASSDKRGLYDPSKDWATGGILVKLANGRQHLNGQQALDLARARGDARGSYGFANSDFDRTAHQRQLILALRDKATTAGVLTNPVKLGKLFDSAGANVKTDFNLGDIRRLYDITKGINAANIQSIGLNNADGVNLLDNYRTPRGESALIPAAGLDNYEDIQQYLKRVTSSNPVVRENATIVLLNGTETSGLAARQSDLLEAKNIAVDSVGDAGTAEYTTTQIIDVTGGKKPGTLAALKKALPGSTVTTVNPYGTKYKADFIVILGTDRVPKPSTTTQ